MSDREDKKQIARVIVKLILTFPLVVFREEIEAVLAIVFVIASLAIAVGAWHFFPDHWYWIALPAIALLALVSWPVLKFCDKVEADFDKGPQS